MFFSMWDEIPSGPVDILVLRAQSSPLTSSTVAIGVQELVCSNRNHLSLQPLCSTSHSSFFLLCLLIFLSGNIEVNPGPCRSCKHTVRANQRGIFCECCYFWYHTKCINMSDDEYSRLGSRRCCNKCFKEALPFFYSSPLPSSENLDGPDSDSDELTSPLVPPSHSVIQPLLTLPAC